MPRIVLLAVLLVVCSPSAGACSYDGSAGATELLRFAHALRRDGRLQEALECYQRLTEVHPRFADGWYELGLARQDRGVRTPERQAQSVRSSAASGLAQPPMAGYVPTAFFCRLLAA